MVETSAHLPTPPRWRRYLSVASVLLFLLLWTFMAEPLIAYALGWWSDSDGRYLMVLRGLMAILLALAFTLRGTWAANGFRGGLQLWWWRALWPVWALALPLLAATAASRSPSEHLLWLLLASVIGFTEEAIFRGVILRALWPGGTRSAIIWSAVWFAAVHLVGLVAGLDQRIVLLMVAGAFAAGLVFAWVRIAAASIWPAVIAHGFYDYSLFVYSGGVRESMEYAIDQVVIDGASIVLLLLWACWLLSLPMSRGSDAARSRPVDAEAPSEATGAL